MEDLERRKKNPILDCRGVNGSMTLCLLSHHVLHQELIAENIRRTDAGKKGRRKLVKFVKVLLSLYSIQLIFISALIMTYLLVTAMVRTETANGNVAVTAGRKCEGKAVTETESLGGLTSSTGTSSPSMVSGQGKKLVQCHRNIITVRWDAEIAPGLSLKFEGVL